jgi:uncharacterized delta-60 repeat protein
MLTMKRILCSILLVAATFFSYAQVTVDPTFNPTDNGYGDFSGVRGSSSNAPGTVYAQAIQSDGKILLGGNMYGYNGYTPTGGGNMNLLRLNANGTRDATFNPTGAGPSGTVYAMLVQSDGKIIIGGNFATYNGVTVNGICRITSTGGFDPTFNPGVGVAGNTATVYSIGIQSTGKIIIGGNFLSYNTITTRGIARLSTNGGLDNTFNVGGTGLSTSSTQAIRALAVQPDDKIIAGGLFNQYNGATKLYIMRINADGDIDPSFTSLSQNINAPVYAINLRSDGKMWIGGNGMQIGTSMGTVVTGVALLAGNGAVDGSFSIQATSGAVYSILPLSNGKLLIGGAITSYNSTAIFGIARINGDASLDATFNMGYNNSSFTTSIYSIQQNTDGSIVYSGGFDNLTTASNNSVEKLTSAQVLDASFNSITGAKGTVTTLVRQTDGKIIIGGKFSAYNGTVRNGIARLTADGEIDNSYNPGTGAVGGINSIAVQSDNKIIAVGAFAAFNGTATGRIARTDVTGAFDAAFTTNNGTGANGAINAVALQADGKIIIGGSFTFFNGNAANYLARLNTNGTFDNTFNIGSGGFGQVRTIEIQADGKILVGGDFQFFNSSTIGRIARLNDDGTIDNTFTPASTGANGPVYAIKVASDGNIFVAGDFTTYNGVARIKLVKLNSLGVLEAAYNYPDISNSKLISIALYPSGKILVVDVYASAIYSMKRLTSNFTIDNSFFTNGPAFPSGSEIAKTVIVGNGDKLLVAGSFSSFNGVGRNRIARLNDASVVPLVLQYFKGSLQNDNGILNWQTTNEINTDKFAVERSINGLDFTAIGNVAAKGNSSNSYQFSDFNLSSHNSKVVYYRLKMIDKDGRFTYSSIVPIKLNGKTSMTISPNPTKGQAWLQLQTSTSEKLEVKVMDISGKAMFVQNHITTAGTTSLPLNISNLQAGVYFVKVVSDKRNETMKLIKE